MFTSNYKNFNGNDYREVAISGDKGKKINFSGNSYPELAPKKDFWKVWHDNIGVLSCSENNKYYVREYYNQVLSKINPDKAYYDLSDKILLCYEEPNEFCHRAVVAAWIKIMFGEEVPEIKLENNHFLPIERNGLEWIEDYLEEVIRDDIKNMRGFNSLMALRLFEKGEQLEAKGYEIDNAIENILTLLNNKNSVSEKDSEKLKRILSELEEKSSYYHSLSAGLRVQADDVEQEYNQTKNNSNNLILK